MSSSAVDSAGAPRRSFGQWLAQSLDVVRRNRFEHYAQMCAHLGDRRVTVRVDDERLTLSGDGESLSLLPAAVESELSLSTSRALILRLLDGEVSLMDAAIGGDLRLCGTPTDLAAFHDGLMSYLHGCVRCAEMPSHLAAFRNEDERL